MIKSWTAANVRSAEQENIWATQSQNEAKLANAFKDSRHVILLFSVNKSVAFQGYVSIICRCASGSATFANAAMTRPAWRACRVLHQSPPGPRNYFGPAQEHFISGGLRSQTLTSAKSAISKTRSTKDNPCSSVAMAKNSRKNLVLICARPSMMRRGSKATRGSFIQNHYCLKHAQ